MKQVYKVPKGVTREQITALVGTQGSLLNPIYEVTNGSTISGGAGFIMTTCTLVCSSSIVTPGVYVNQFYNNVSI